VGGFSKAPAERDLAAFLPHLEDAAERVLEVADWVGALPVPTFVRPAELVSMVHPSEYPINEGDIESSTGRTFDAITFEQNVHEVQVPHSNALHARLVDGGAYVVGPLARVNLNAGRLTPLAREAARRAGLSLPTHDPFASMAARVAETALAVEESIRLIRGYGRPEPPMADVRPRPGRAAWVTEAPRGTLYHRYDVHEDGMIAEAKIVPPTSQNLRHMEEDLRLFVPTVLDRSDEDLTRLCEMVVRNYDPCISCATHFLTLDLERR
jgi:coenzyme F420-reducing hydrogenase alpha subunit